MSRRIDVSRRQFLKWNAQAAAIAVPYFTPSSEFRANEKVQLGFIGAGQRGQHLMRSVPKDEFAIVAFSDLHEGRMERARTEFNQDGAMYKDYRDMLASDDVDAVVVATPEHWHALATIDACKAGKDVYTEKPLALTIAEGRAMIKAAREHDRIVQVGTQQRNRFACMQGCQAILDGAIGKVTEVHGMKYPSPWECDIAEEQDVPDGLDWDTWLGQASPRPYHNDIFNRGPKAGSYPDGRPRGWPNFTRFGGGSMTAWGAHGLDTIAWALGSQVKGPVEVWPERVDEKGPIKFLFKKIDPDSWKEGHALTCPVHFRYADGTMIHLDGKGPGFGGTFVGEEGVIMVDRNLFQTKRSGGEMKTVREPQGTGDGAGIHMKQWLECIKSRVLPRADLEIAHASCTMCHLGNIARWVGRKITWDPETETFGDDEEANSYVRRKAREPWAVV